MIASRSAAFLGDKTADVVADGDRLWLGGESGHESMTACSQDVVQQHGVDTPENQIAVRMDVVVVRDRLQAQIALGLQQDLVRDRAAQRGHAPAAEIGERAIARGVGVADAEDFAKFVVRNGRRERGPARRRVLDAAQRDVGIAPLDRLIERLEPHAARIAARGRVRARRGRRSRRRSRPADPDGSGRPRQTARLLRNPQPRAGQAASAVARRLPPPLRLRRTGQPSGIQRRHARPKPSRYQMAARSTTAP